MPESKYHSVLRNDDQTRNHPARPQDWLIGVGCTTLVSRQEPVDVSHGSIILTDRSRGKSKTSACVTRNRVKLMRRQSRPE